MNDMLTPRIKEYTFNIGDRVRIEDSNETFVVGRRSHNITKCVGAEGTYYIPSNLYAPADSCGYYLETCLSLVEED